MSEYDKIKILELERRIQELESGIDKLPKKIETVPKVKLKEKKRK